MHCTCDKSRLGGSFGCPMHGAPQSVARVKDDPSPLQVQVGGGHYKKLKIQPVEYIHQNGLGFLEGCIVKRITRWRDKDGIQDLEKIKHEVDLLIDQHRKATPGAA